MLLQLLPGGTAQQGQQSRIAAELNWREVELALQPQHCRLHLILRGCLCCCAWPLRLLLPQRPPDTGVVMSGGSQSLRLVAGDADIARLQEDMAAKLPVRQLRNRVSAPQPGLHLSLPNTCPPALPAGTPCPTPTFHSPAAA